MAAAATAAVGEGMWGCEEMGNEGEVESMPEVVNGVRSSTSGKCTRAEFFDAYVPKCTERLRCSVSTGGGWAWIELDSGPNETASYSPARPWLASLKLERIPSLS